MVRVGEPARRWKAGAPGQLLYVGAGTLAGYFGVDDLTILKRNDHIQQPNRQEAYKAVS